MSTADQTSGKWRIPLMTNPLGRHWGQPAGLRDRIGLFFNHATILERDWLALSNYESSVPSGVYPGKVWRRGSRLCWYGPERGGRCHIGYLRALVQGPGINATHRSGVTKTTRSLA